MNWEKRWSRRTSTRYTSIIGWKLTTMADSWPTMISRKRGIMSFWRVISEAQFLRTEFLRITAAQRSSSLLPALVMQTMPPYSHFREQCRIADHHLSPPLGAWVVMTYSSEATQI
jgi:hypothetical protein